VAEYDGTIKLKVDLDTEEVGKKSKRLSRGEKDALKAQAEQFKKEAAELQAKADELRKMANEVRGKLTDKALSKEQQSEYVKEADMLAKQGADFQRQANRLNDQAADALKPLDNIGARTKKTTANFSKMAKGITASLKKIKNMILGAFVFAVIGKAIQSASVYLKEMIIQNDALKNSLGQVKGNLETTFITVLEAIMPIIEEVAGALAKLTAGMAALVANMFGKTVGEAQASAKKVADAAKKTAGNLAGFDEIATLPDNEQTIESKYEVEADAINDVPEALIESGDAVKDIFESVFGIIRELIPKIVEFIKKLLPVIAPILKLVADILPLLSPIIDLITDLLEPIGQLLAEILPPLVEIITELITGYLSFAMPILKAEIKFIVNYISEAIKTVVTIFKNIIDFFKNIFAGDWEAAWQNILNIVGAYIDFFKNIIKSVGTFISDIWNHVADIFGGVWDKIVMGAKLAFWGIQTAVLTVVNFVIDVVNGMIEGVLAPLNLLIDGLNLIPGVNIGKLALAIPSIPLPPIPALAQGGVVPRSKPFLAMLGDNTQETEIVSPESTMKQAFIEALTEAGLFNRNNDGQIIALYINEREFGRATVDLGDAERSRRGANLTIKRA
jgi:phage-related protein